MLLEPLRYEAAPHEPVQGERKAVRLRPEHWLTHVVATVCGEATARRALRLATRLYPAPAGDALRRRCRFLLRTLWYGHTSAAWFAFLDASAFRRRLARLQPQLAERLHRPYRRCDLDAAQRLALLVGHHEAVEALGWESLVLSICTRPWTIASVVGKDNVERTLVLGQPGQFAKEGEACVHLMCGAKRLYTAAFSLQAVRGPSAALPAWQLDIACVQGPDDGAAQELVRSTTKALHGLRPRDLVVAALRSVAQVIGAPSFVGVASARHVYRHWRKRRTIAFDYDSFWREHAGRLGATGDHEIPAVFTPSPIDHYPSNKRAEARRRIALVEDVRCQIVRAIQSTIPVGSRPRARLLHGESTSTAPL